MANNMKKSLFLSAFVLVLAGCTSTTMSNFYYVVNQTDKELIVQPRADRVVTVLPDEYLGLFGLFYSKDMEAPENVDLSSSAPLYITLDGVRYQVTKEPDGCLYSQSYYEAPDSIAAQLRESKQDRIFLFPLTEDYIKSQLVVEDVTQD